MDTTATNRLPLPLKLFLDQQFQASGYSVKILPTSGSSRRYARIFHEEKSYMAAYNEHVWENEVFFHFTTHFLEKQLPVPDLLSVSEDKQSYLLQDLGDVTLASLLPETGIKDIHHPLITHYKTALSDLTRFQINGNQGYDWTYSFPIDTMNEKAIRWDLNYFKYYFLHVSGMNYHELELENAFDTFVSLLLQFDNSYLMFRDFQSRNIMIHNDKLYYIDYQGSRKGFLTYDVVSLLFQAKAKTNEAVREELLHFYIDTLLQKIDIDTKNLITEFYFVALLRNLQTLGAYGFRGLIQKKPHFIQSIQSALDNLLYLIEKLKYQPSLKPLLDILYQMINCIKK